MPLVTILFYIQSIIVIKLVYKAFYSIKINVEKRGDQGRISDFGHPGGEDINRSRDSMTSGDVKSQFFTETKNWVRRKE